MGLLDKTGTVGPIKKADRLRFSRSLYGISSRGEEIPLSCVSHHTEQRFALMLNLQAEAPPLFHG